MQYKYLFQSHIVYKTIVNLFFVFGNCIIYFWILKAINHGIFHLYFSFMLIGGFVFGNYLVKDKK